MAAPVGLAAEAPDVVGKLGQLLNLRHQRAVVQQEEQSAQQRKNIAAYDWNRHLGDDGTLDVDSFAADPEAPVIFGDQYADYLTRTAQAKQQQLTAKQTLMGLRTEQRKEFADLMTALRSDKDVAEDNEAGRQKVNAEMIRFGEIYGPDALPVLKAYAPGIKNVPKGRMGDALRAIGLQAADADRQLEMQQPTYTSTGSKLTNVNPNVAPGTAPDIALTVAPGFELFVDGRTGNPYLYNAQTGEARDFGSGVPGGVAPSTRIQPRPAERPASLPGPMEPGEAATIAQQADTNFENVNANRQAAGMAPQQLDQINKALDLSRQVSTGAWAAGRARVESGLGSLIPGFQGMDDATKLQELDKFAERIATDASRVLGVNAKTDAERESIHKQNANIGYTPKAIQAVLSYAKAQTLAMEAKGNAQEAWLSAGNKVTKQHEFETKFRQAYDPRVFQFEVMSAPEQENFLKGLSKEERKSLREKTQALIELGAIPGG